VCCVVAAKLVYKILYFEIWREEEGIKTLEECDT